MKLRVCNIAKHIYPPSLNGHIQNLETFRALSPYFEKIYLIVQSADESARMERIGNICVYQVPRITWSGVVNHIMFIGRAFLYAHRLWRKGCIDVCDGSEPLSGGVVAWLLRRLTGLPCLVELQGDGLEFDAGVHPPVKELLFRSIIKAVVREADHIRAISDRVAAQATRAGVDGRRITVATSRVNLRRFQGRGSTTMRDAVRHRHAISNDKVVGYLGRLHHLKGLITLLRAWPLVTAQVPDATLVIVGDGPERQHLHRLASTIEGPARVVFAGACAYDDVPLWLDAFDIFVLPSLTEGTPRALLEAMAMELPVVATSVGDIPQGVLDPSSGVVVPPAEPEALANAILALLADPTKAQAMGRNARNTVVGKFEFAESIRNLALSHYRAAGRPMPLGT